jgi:CheY-like chemotaxis protein
MTAEPLDLPDFRGNSASAAAPADASWEGGPPGGAVSPQYDQRASRVTAPLVLVADDHADIREAFVEELREAGFRTVEAENGVVALKLAHELLPDAVLLDFAMPMMDGIQASLCLKRDPHTRSIPIVMISAYGDLVGTRGRWDSFLDKPCDPRDAVETISALLARGRGVGPPGFGSHETPTLPGNRSLRGGTDAPLVLVVDDQEDLRRMYAKSLEAMGYRTVSVDSGEQAVDLALRLRPSAVVMDVAMPGIGGIEATRLIKTDARGRAIFIVLMTAYGTALFDEAREAGCDAYFCKPFNPFALDLVLRALQSPPPRGEPSAIIKRCGCGRSYTHREWIALPLCGRMHLPGGPEILELRNCPCGSSLGVGLQHADEC